MSLWLAGAACPAAAFRTRIRTEPRGLGREARIAPFTRRQQIANNWLAAILGVDDKAVVMGPSLTWRWRASGGRITGGGDISASDD